MERPWEESRPPMASSGGPPTTGRQSLPSLSELAQGVPAIGSMGRTDDSPLGVHSIRDSGNWSMQSPSKHSSVMSSSTNGIQLPSLNSSHTSPNGHSGHLSASSDRSPFSSHFSNGVCPASDVPTAHLSQINRTYDPTSSHAVSSRLSDGVLPSIEHHSRLDHHRSSVDARMNLLALASPLPSANASQTSLVSDLQRERGIPTDTARSSGFSVASSHSRIPDDRVLDGTITTSLGRKVVSGRTAPPIDANPRLQWPNPNAETPTKGFPYAFPDPDVVSGLPSNSTDGAQRSVPPTPLAPSAMSASGEPAGTIGPITTPAASRRGSIGALSVNSSIFTNDSRQTTAGRRPREQGSNGYGHEEFGHHTSYFNDRSSADFSGVPNHHHHQMQNKSVDGMMDDDDPESPNGQTPYSRTPELRVSHKLAERKRRSEMKGLFEELRARIPADGRVSKTSKWEILTKAIEYIKGLEHNASKSNGAAEAYRREADRCYLLEREVAQLKDELTRARARPSGPASTNILSQYHQRVGPPNTAATLSTSSRSNLSSLPPPIPSGSMQGVQYHQGH